MTDEQNRATITIDEAAVLLGISRWTAYKQAKTGTLAGVPVLKVGKRVLVPRVPFERALNGGQES